jgi:hypothetical protein
MNPNSGRKVPSLTIPNPSPWAFVLLSRKFCRAAQTFRRHRSAAVPSRSFRRHRSAAVPSRSGATQPQRRPPGERLRTGSHRLAFAPAAGRETRAPLGLRLRRAGSIRVHSWLRFGFRLELTLPGSQRFLLGRGRRRLYCRVHENLLRCFSVELGSPHLRRRNRLAPHT